MEKLVRDKFSENTGGNCKTRIAESDEEYMKFLRAKILDKAAEFVEADEHSKAEKIADILEIIRAGAAFHNISIDELESLRRKKFEEKGGFEKRIIWDARK